MAYRGSPKGGSFRRPVLRGEELVQQAIVDALRLALPDCLVFSIPNQTAGNAIQGMKMKLTGQVGGIPDLCVIGIGHTGDTVTMFLQCLQIRIFPLSSERNHMGTVNYGQATCRECSVRFTRNAQNQVYCSPDCRDGNPQSECTSTHIGQAHFEKHGLNYATAYIVAEAASRGAMRAV
jgi:hypothetical protein